MNSYQNLIFLQNLYRLKALGINYVDHLNINKSSFSQANSYDELVHDISSCFLCDLSKSRSQTMVGFGNEKSDIVFLDFQVSQEQDSNNDYFVGRSGESLKNMIENVLQMSIKDIFYTHCIKCKSLHSAKTLSSEWKTCKAYLFSQIEFIKPKIIVILGQEAYFHFTGGNNDFQKVRGHVIDFKSYKVVPIFHPSYLLRNPNLKKITLNDLKMIKNFLQK